MKQMDINDFFRANLDLTILRLLDSQSELYGYQIVKLLLAYSNGKITIGFSALYPSLHRLQLDGLIKVREEMNGARKRIYYSLTQKGRKEGKAGLEQLAETFRSMSRILNLQPI